MKPKTMSIRPTHRIKDQQSLQVSSQRHRLLTSLRFPLIKSIDEHFRAVATRYIEGLFIKNHEKSLLTWVLW